MVGYILILILVMKGGGQNIIIPVFITLGKARVYI